MENAINSVRKGLLLRSAAMAKHKARKQAFIKARARIIHDFEAAEKIWAATYEKLSASAVRVF